MNKTTLIAATILGILTVRAPGAFANADGARTLSLGECIDLCRNNSPEIAIARESYRRKTLLHQSYIAGLLPRLELSGNLPDYSYRSDDSYSPPLENQSSAAGASLSISQTVLPTGGRISVSSGLLRRNSWGDSVRTGQWEYGPAVTFSQPLALHVPSLWEWRLQKQQQDFAQRQFLETSQAALVQMCDRFFALYHSQYSLESARRNAAVNDTIYQLNQGRYSVGRIAENDLLESELALLNANSSIETAIIERDRAQAALKNMLGLDDDRELAVTFDEEIPKGTMDADLVIRCAHAHGAMDALLRSSWLQSRSEISAARSNGLPSARVEVTAGLERTAASLEALPLSEDYVRAAVQVKVPLFDWGQNPRKLRAARAEQSRVHLDSALQKKQLEQALRFMIRDLDQIRRQVSIAAKSDTISMRRLEVAINRYVIGKIDIREIRAAQIERDAARRAYISNLQRFWRTWYELRRVTLYDFEEDRPLN